MSVITKDKLLIYQLLKIIEVLFILLFLMIYSLLFGISLKVFCIFFLRLEIFSNQKCLSKHCYIYIFSLLIYDQCLPEQFNTRIRILSFQSSLHSFAIS